MNVWTISIFTVIFNIVIYFSYYNRPFARWEFNEKIAFFALVLAIMLDVILTYIFTSLGYSVEVNPIFETKTPDFWSLLIPKILTVFTVFHLLMYEGTRKKLRKTLLILSNTLMWIVVLILVVGAYISCQYGYLYE